MRVTALKPLFVQDDRSDCEGPTDATTSSGKVYCGVLYLFFYSLFLMEYPTKEIAARENKWFKG